ncbi:MAG TPA: hypothetical protein VMA36_20615 [Candidatus Limnocylindria bacterium]|jgi:hypothetical protein|nr:hypothetical protein [Candidatus Limnocylindria bacterium]
MDVALIALIGWGGFLAIGVSMALSAEYIPPERRCTCKHPTLPAPLGNVLTSQVKYVALERHGEHEAGSVVAQTCRIHLN